MRHLTAAETNGHLHLIALGQKLLRLADLGVEVVRVDVEGKADLLDVDDLLVFLRFLVAFLHLEAVLPVIQEFAHGRLRLRCDLHEVQIFFFRFCKRVARGHDAELAAVRVDDTHLSVANAFIDFHFFFAANRKAPPNVSVAAGAARL